MPRYNNIVMDAEEVECSQFPGQPLLHLDFKAIFWSICCLLFSSNWAILSLKVFPQAVCFSSRGPNILIVIIVVEVARISTTSWYFVKKSRIGHIMKEYNNQSLLLYKNMSGNSLGGNSGKVLLGLCGLPSHRWAQQCLEWQSGFPWWSAWGGMMELC